MTIGILGAGNIGKAVARQLIRAGYEVIISNRRGGDSLAPLVRELGSYASPGSAREAAHCEVVVLAVPWNQVAPLLGSLPPWRSQVLIDATNPITPDLRAVDLGTRTSSEVVAGLAGGARVVKSFNTLRPDLLAANTREAGGRRVMFYAGDDADAKQTVNKLLETVGFAAVDLGDLATGGRMMAFPGGPLPTLNLVRLS
jgi:predicted dinucleotide-binding enzyme